MAKTLASLQSQIEKLQQQADVLKQKETPGVISKIRTAIEFYGLTADDLFGSTAPRAKGGRQSAKKPRTKATASPKTARPVKYSDGANNWVGQGKRPRWFVAALAAGKTAEDLLVKAE